MSVATLLWESDRLSYDRRIQFSFNSMQPQFEVEYLTDKAGQPKAVVIPIELWKQLFPQEDLSTEEIVERIEDYCLSRAMDEAENSPLLDRDAALAFLEE
jgi:hypothetical protein